MKNRPIVPKKVMTDEKRTSCNEYTKARYFFRVTGWPEDMVLSCGYVFTNYYPNLCRIVETIGLDINDDFQINSEIPGGRDTAGLVLVDDAALRQAKPVETVHGRHMLGDVHPTAYDDDECSHDDDVFLHEVLLMPPMIGTRLLPFPSHA